MLEKWTDETTRSFFHRACTALRALALRCSGVKTAALACPPLDALATARVFSLTRSTFAI